MSKRFPDSTFEPYERAFDREATARSDFWDQVALDTHRCWEWMGGRFANGYGRVWINNKGVGAHRIAYEMETGAIPDDLVIDHTCRNRACVRPDHMELVTRAENTRRGTSKQWKLARRGNK